MIDEQRPINPIKLQKLVYISYGWCWAILEEELFEEEIQAWKYGPVVPSVWTAFNNQRPKIGKPVNIDSQSSNLDENTKKLHNTVYEVYVNQQSAEMIAITHAPGTPWSSLYDSTRNKEIPKHVIWRYYELLCMERRKNLQK